MKEQKKIAVWTGIICVIAFFVAVVANCNGYSFVSNIFIGIFSSSLLACLISMISYFVERKKTIALLYNGCLDFNESLNLNLSREGIIDIKEAKANLMVMKSVYQKDVFPHASQLISILNKSTLKGIVSDIDKYAENLYRAICADIDAIDEFYMGNIAQEEMVHYKWKYLTSDSINSLKLLYESLDSLARNQFKNSIKEAKSDAD